MTDAEQERILQGFAQVLSTHDWDRLGDVVHDDIVVEYPQSGERFVGLANVRGQFENYPDLGPGSSELREIVGDRAFALTPSYTLIDVDGSGGRGTAVVRVRYPDGSLWWALTVYELRDGRIGRLRSFFAPDFEAPDWRAPYREAP